MTVERIMKMKGSYVPTAAPEALISDVLESLEIEDTGALVVTADGEHIDGIISRQDIVRGLRQFGAALLRKCVREIMSPNQRTCEATDRVAGIMAVMDERNLVNIPVVEGDRLAGIVNIRDIVKLRLDEVQSEADAMRSYIGGHP